MSAAPGLAMASKTRGQRDVMSILPSAVLASTKARQPTWERELIVKGEEGTPRRNLANVMCVLAAHPAWDGVLAYDAFAEGVVCLRTPPVRQIDEAGDAKPGDWTEEDGVRTAAWFSKVIGFDPAIDMVHQAVTTIAKKRRVHPVCDWLGSLTWDGVRRLDGMLPVYFGAADTPYARAVGSRWMISAVARVMGPGCQADSMLVLESEKQGIGKSTAIRVLAGEWYADTGVVVGDKDSYQALRRVWIYEFAELSAIKGREAERVKNFVSSRQDHYRPSYGRFTRDFPRQCVFCGSTNETAYLVDRTGNRRFWPVRCTSVDVPGLTRDRDQLWAEALTRYKAGEVWFANSAELVRLCQEEQADRQAPDDWLPIVLAWLKRPTLPDDYDGRRLIRLDDGITTADVLLGAINMRPGDMTTAASTRAGHVLRDAGFVPTPNAVKHDGKRQRVYFRGTPDTGAAPAIVGCAA